jgi:predicted nucleic acid-binding protein
MRIVVSDTSCLIDLRRVSLLDALLRLPYEFLIPDTLFEDELLSFPTTQKDALIQLGLKVVDLPGEQVLRAQRVLQESPRLSVHDGFAFALAESSPGCILLTGDNRLRALANRHQIETHGVLWVLDEIHRCDLAATSDLITALQLFARDPTVRLPNRVLASYLSKYCDLAGESAVE